MKFSTLNNINRFFAIFVLFVFISCNSQPSLKKQSPATIENAVKETDLTTITLTPKAEGRLGVETAMVEEKQIPTFFDLGGEIIAPPGQEVTIITPAAGTVLLGVENRAIQAGSRVGKGEEIMRLLLLPPEKDMIGAKEELEVRQVEYNVAKAKMDRAEQLVKDKAVSEKAYQEAQATLALASALLKAAQAKVNLLTGSNLDSAAAGLSNLVLESPMQGVVQQLYVASGQTVPASTPLFKVASQNPVWVRVPVYSGDLAKINRSQNAIVKTLGNANERYITNASPIEGPPLSDMNSASSDFYYKIDNSDGQFRIGMRVKVELMQHSQEYQLVIPFSSIVYDINGGTWLYVKKQENQFSRQRVEIANIIIDTAILRKGVSAGVEVVITAVAELYGTEFGGGK